MHSLTLDSIIKGLDAVGIKSGDTVLVHSSFKSFGPVNGGAETIIEALLTTLGSDGTLLVPTFNYEFCEGVPYDRKNTPSKMGIISELIRKRSDAKRIYHPIFGFAAIGSEAKSFGKIKNISAYGADSAFTRLMELDGKILILGLSYNDSMTFFHYVEETVGCNYRYMKDFTGKIIYEDNTSKVETFKFFVRDLEKGVVSDLDPMGARLEELGLVTQSKIGNCVAKMIKSREAFGATKKVILHEPYLLRKII